MANRQPAQYWDVHVGLQLIRILGGAGELFPRVLRNILNANWYKRRQFDRKGSTADGLWAAFHVGLPACMLSAALSIFTSFARGGQLLPAN